MCPGRIEADEKSLIFLLSLLAVVFNICLLIHKVEAKRAVPRSEISRSGSTGSTSAASPKAGQGAGGGGAVHKVSNAGGGGTGGGSQSSSGGGGAVLSVKSPTSAGLSTASAQPSPHTDSTGGRHGGDSSSKLGIEDYAYNKIFVGGLHYDTRDGRFCFRC